MLSKNKTVLITGGTGFVGFSVIKFCVLRKWKVVSLSTNKPRKSRKLKNVKYIVLDISKKNSLQILNKFNFDHVINCAGYVNHKNYKKTYNSHYIGCKNLYSYFKEKKIKSFVQVGSSSEYGMSKAPQSEDIICKPEMIYGKSKLKATNFFIDKFNQENFPVIILRFFQIYGPHQDKNRFIPIIIDGCLKNKKFYCSDGKQSRDFIYIDDAVKVIIKTMKTKKAVGNIINIGCGKAIILKKVIKMIIKFSKGGKPLYGKIKLRTDEPKKVYPSIKKAKNLLNWSTKVDIVNGIKKTIKFYKQNNQV